jgi:excisionase family DNA binding protein
MRCKSWQTTCIAGKGGSVRHWPIFEIPARSAGVLGVSTYYPLVTRDCTSPRWLTPPQLAEMLGVEPAKVLAWINRGELRAVNVADKKNGKRPRWRISEEAVDSFLRQRESKPSTRLQPQQRKVRDLYGLTA